MMMNDIAAGKILHFVQDDTEGNVQDDTRSDWTDGWKTLWYYHNKSLRGDREG